ncbi:MAG: hypothetical protein Q9195_005882 [Heterodermia aff. obscurata]
MAEVFIPRQPLTHPPVGQRTASGPHSFMPTATAGSITEQNSNPVFPLPTPTVAPYTSLSTKETRTQRSKDRTRPQQLSFDTLPLFKFNPSDPSDSASSGPGCMPTRRTPPCSNIPTGHRRNGSELIGGDGQVAVTAPSSASPTKNGFPLELSPTLYNGPSASRRGHAHRRSGAVSSHDLSSVVKPAKEPKGSSLPTTPSDFNDHYRPSPYSDKSFSYPPEVSMTPTDDPPTPIPAEDNRAKAFPRPRVGFSDTIEFIPRPLSTISSETSSSLSTIRASHSLTGSISSIISGRASSPPPVKPNRSLSDPTMERSMSLDPHTARVAATPKELEWMEAPEARTDWQQDSDPVASAFYISQEGAATSTMDSTKAPVANSIMDAPSTDQQMLALPFHAKAQPPSMKSVLTASVFPRPRSSPEPKDVSMQNKVKSWAENFLPRKPRMDENFQSTSAPVPDPSHRVSFASVDDLSLEHISFDEDTSCVIRDPSLITPPPRAQHSLHRVGKANASDEDELSGPMLDLDAAFGLAHASSFGSNSDDTFGGGCSVTRRRMHSSGITGGFSGPGMHYHRRAESAPEMAHFDYHTLGFPRFGSNPKMADVFEEEEEDEEEEDGNISDDRKHLQLGSLTPQSSTLTLEGEAMTSGLGVKIVDVGPCNDEHRRQRSSRYKPGNAIEVDPSFIDTDRDDGGIIDFQEENATDFRDALIEIVEVDEEPRTSALSKSSDDHVSTPTLSTKPTSARPVSEPMTTSLHSMTPETLSSTMSSPEFSRTSFDVPRLHTANSSITDRMTLSSCRAGEHSVSLRASVDDVPSLSSSSSTAISAQPPRLSSSAHTRSSTERSSSLSAAVSSTCRPAITSKRSSIVSLSRLVGHAHGARSKLHIEERAQVETLERAEKRKGNRMSRLVRFWKARGKSSSP